MREYLLIRDIDKIHNVFVNALRKRNIRIANQEMTWAWVEDKVFRLKQVGVKGVSIESIECWVFMYDSIMNGPYTKMEQDLLIS